MGAEADLLPPRERAFREEARAFVSANLPADIRSRIAAGLAPTKNDVVRWQRILAARGWLAPGWPREWGGCDWTPLERHLFDEISVELDAPFVNPFGLFRVAPVIYTFGAEAQKRRYLPRILASEDWWCQGYSEPNAGSDLAALETRAVRDGDAYVVTGRKIWTTNAHLADRMFALVRTSREARPQAGISFLLVDLRLPGVAIRPIVTLDGLHHVNEVVLDAVRVPAADLVGEAGRGWAYSKLLLGFERFQIAEVPQSRRLLARLRRLATTLRRGGRRLADDPWFGEKLARAEIALLAHAQTTLRYLALFQSQGAIGPEVSMLKVRGAEIRQNLAALTLEALGEQALACAGDAAAPAVAHFLYSRGASVYGGSNEIQRNLLARHVLGG
jgi:alkylation response protein AidB-like acyl-CoA dehydrogenase